MAAVRQPGGAARSSRRRSSAWWRRRILWHRLLGRPASESGRLCHGDVGHEGATAAGGCYCCLRSQGRYSTAGRRELRHLSALGPPRAAHGPVRSRDTGRRVMSLTSVMGPLLIAERGAPGRQRPHVWHKRPPVLGTARPVPYWSCGARLSVLSVTMMCSSRRPRTGSSSGPIRWAHRPDNRPLRRLPPMLDETGQAGAVTAVRAFAQEGVEVLAKDAVEHAVLSAAADGARCARRFGKDHAAWKIARAPVG